MLTYILLSIIALLILEAVSLTRRLSRVEAKTSLAWEQASIAFNLIKHHRHDASCHTCDPTELKKLDK